jgi:hypothetical protein
MGRRDRATHERTHAVTVCRIISNIAAADMAAAKRFYHDVLGLEVVADLGWTAPTSDSGSPG